MRLPYQNILSRFHDDNKELISPYPQDSAFGSASVDLTISNVFKVFKKEAYGVEVDPLKDDLSVHMEEIIIEDDNYFKLAPLSFALSCTVENVYIPPDLYGLLDGRSTFARAGLCVHLTAHTMQPAFEGKIVLELFNAGPATILIKPGSRICSLAYQKLISKTARPYNKNKNSKYNGQYDVKVSQPENS